MADLSKSFILVIGSLKLKMVSQLAILLDLISHPYSLKKLILNYNNLDLYGSMVYCFQTKALINQPKNWELYVYKYRTKRYLPAYINNYPKQKGTLMQGKQGGCLCQGSVLLWLQWTYIRIFWVCIQTGNLSFSLLDYVVK